MLREVAMMVNHNFTDSIVYSSQRKATLFCSGAH